MARITPKKRGLPPISRRFEKPPTVLRQSLKFAVERGLIGSNPARFVRPNRRPKLSRFLSRDEIRRLHHALDRHAEGRRSAQADIIRLLILTGCFKWEGSHVRHNGNQTVM